MKTAIISVFLYGIITFCKQIWLSLNENLTKKKAISGLSHYGPKGLWDLEFNNITISFSICSPKQQLFCAWQLEKMTISQQQRRAHNFQAENVHLSLTTTLSPKWSAKYFYTQSGAPAVCITWDNRSSAIHSINKETDNKLQASTGFPQDPVSAVSLILHFWLGQIKRNLSCPHFAYTILNPVQRLLLKPHT